MTDIYNIRLLDIIPPNLRSDPDIIAASRAVDKEFALLVTAAQKCVILPNIDNASSEVVDLLAFEFHVDFYDPALPIEIRREIVKNSIPWHIRKGTSSAVEELISLLFDEGIVEEWFEYGGDPYNFRVITNNASVTGEQAEEFIKALESVKNARSRLEVIIITMSENLNNYFAGVVYTGDRIILEQVI